MVSSAQVLDSCSETPGIPWDELAGRGCVCVSKEQGEKQSVFKGKGAHSLRNGESLVPVDSQAPKSTLEVPDGSQCTPCSSMFQEGCWCSLNQLGLLPAGHGTAT